MEKSVVRAWECSRRSGRSLVSELVPSYQLAHLEKVHEIQLFQASDRSDTHHMLHDLTERGAVHDHSAKAPTEVLAFPPFQHRIRFLKVCTR